MTRSSRRKALDVSAETISAADRNINVNAVSTPTKQSLKPAMSDEAAFSDPFDPELNFEFDEEEESSTLADELADDGSDEADIWAEALEDKWQEDDPTASMHYFEEEFELHGEDDPEFALFPGEVSQGPTVPEILKQGMVKALAAHSSPEFWQQVVQTLNQATATLRPPQPARKPPRNGAKSKPNGHHPDLKQQALSQPLRSRLRELTFLAQRYAKRGLSEIDLLEDALALLSEIDGKVLSPVLAGLAARLAVKPKLEQSDQRLHPAMRQELLSAANRSVSLLSQHGALEALPGLAAMVGQHTIRRQRPLDALPTDFYQAATRVAANPNLQQRLAHFTLEEPASFAIDQHQMPMTLRINGPIEIHIQRSQG